MSDSLPSLEQLDDDLRRVRGADHYRLRKFLQSVRRAQRAGKPFDRNLKKLAGQIADSAALRERRAERLPAVTFPDELPITAKVDQLSEIINSHQVIIVCGETGSGKSTQLPKLCLQLGRGIDGLIGHTQPRRIAARSVADRIADELSRPLGKDVGFKIRFTDQTGEGTYIKLMTDGILLAETQSDRFLNQYDTLIIDEAHERSLNIDFLLGYLKQILPKRPDLKVIITSATIDVERFAAHFPDRDGQPAPTVLVEGRTYPVEVRYRPVEADPEDDGSRDPDPMRHLVTAVAELARETPVGDTLVFMPTERDIREAAKHLRSNPLPGDTAGRQTEILPLYGRLSTKDQNRVFQPSAWRRIVIATNVAESSLTVPGIRYVVDAGTARISRYSARSKVQRLPIEPISQASADQRKGRCGRVGPGVCVRLYSEADFNSREEYTPPEILRTNLASVILQTKALRLGDIEQFPFLEPPKPGTVRDGYNTLYELGAIDDRNELTAIGHQLSRLPVDPRIGRMILAAAEEGCLAEVLIIAAALEIQDPRERPIDKQKTADDAHSRFVHEDSDFVSLLKLWGFYHKLKEELSRSRLRKACFENFLSYNRLREWSDIHQQLGRLATEAGLKASDGRQPIERSKKRARNSDDITRQQYDSLHRALLSGLLSNVAFRPDKHEYTGANNTKFQLWPGSGAFSKKPRWVMAAELVETSNRYLRCVGRINPDWIEPLAGHLVTRTHSEPHWSAENGSAMAFERVTLYGLTVVPRRSVRYGRIAPAKSRELFLYHALVEGDWETKHAFFQHNRKLLEEVERMQAKSRHVDLMTAEDDRFEFFNSRVPNSVVDAPSFDKWYRQASRDEPRLLCMQKSDLVRDDAEQVQDESFPDSLTVNRMRLPLEYHLQPGAAEDGITLVVPQEGVGQLEPRRMGWLVPGLLEEKVVALIKSLPKNVRLNFVPAPDTAKQVVSRIAFGEGDVLEQVSRELTKIAGEPVPVSLLDESRLPAHLRMNVRVVDAGGETLKTARNLDEVLREVGKQTAAQFSAADKSGWHRDGVTEWDFGTLPKSVEVAHNGVTMPGYPTLIDAGETAALRLVNSEAKATRCLQAGVRRLFTLQAHQNLKRQVDYLPDIVNLAVWAGTLPDGAAGLRKALADLLADRAYFGTKPECPRTAAEFSARVKEAGGRIAVEVRNVSRLITQIREAHQEAKKSLKGTVPESWRYAIDDMRGQLDLFTAKNFLLDTPWPWLCQAPRYMNAVRARRLKLHGAGLGKDQKLWEKIKPHWTNYRQRAESHAARELFDPHLEHYRWMIEEFRVSLYAPQLGTAVPVSAEKLDEQWSRVQA